MVPMVEAPDEYCHFWVYKFLFNHGRLPLANEVQADGMVAVYGSLPQLGYLPHVLASKLLPFWDISLSARFGSLFLALLAIIAAYFVGQAIFPKNKIAQLALPLLMIFHPQLVLVHSYINTDATVSALGALIVLLLIYSIKSGLSLRGCAGLGFLLGCLALSKYSAYSLFFGSAFALLVSDWRQAKSAVAIGQRLAVVAFTCLATCGWWFIREISQYPDDLLGTKTMYRTWAFYCHKPLTYHVNVWHIIKDVIWWRLAIFSYWGVFGYMTRYLWRPIYVTYIGFTMLAIVGGAFKLADWRNISALLAKLASRDLPPADKQALDTAVIISTFIICLLANILAMIWSSSLNLGGPQGRYLFGCEVPILSLIVWGLLSVSSRFGQWLVVSLVAFNALAYFAAVAMLYPIYGFHVKPY